MNIRSWNIACASSLAICGSDIYPRHTALLTSRFRGGKLSAAPKVPVKFDGKRVNDFTFHLSTTMGDSGFGTEFENGHDRRSFLRNAGLAAGFSRSGLLAVVARLWSEASAAPMEGGKYDFDTPYNRIGFDDIKWDGAIRTEHMSKIVAGMGIADMDFRCYPGITEALRKRITHESWGYLDMGSPGPEAFTQGLIEWNRKRYGITAMNKDNLGITTGVHAGIMATLRAYAPQGSKVLMATPIYNGFYYDIMGSKLIANESLMHYSNGRYEIDWDDFERRMTPDTKVSILCNPQNPVGSRLDQGRAAPLWRALSQA